jgi:hypothetical protein
VSIARIRLQRSDLPSGPSLCPFACECPYRVKAVCDDPRTNKGNSDAGCFGWTNKVLVGALIPLPGSVSRGDCS